MIGGRFWVSAVALTNPHVSFSAELSTGVDPSVDSAPKPSSSDLPSNETESLADDIIGGFPVVSTHPSTCFASVDETADYVLVLHPLDSTGDLADLSSPSVARAAKEALKKGYSRPVNFLVRERSSCPHLMR